MHDPMSDPSAAPLAAGHAVNLTSSLEDFQPEEQRLVLDTVAQIRKCGLEAVLPLPQIAVCGNQSAGKSSVLEDDCRQAVGSELALACNRFPTS